jgi:hypothetical protein
MNDQRRNKRRMLGETGHSAVRFCCYMQKRPFLPILVELKWIGRDDIAHSSDVR